MAAYARRNPFTGTMIFIMISFFFFFFISFRQAGAEITVHESSLRDLDCFTTIMSMSGAHKTNWWHFLPYLKSSTDKAFLAYMVSNFSENSSGVCDFDTEIEEKAGLFFTRSSSIAEDSTTERIDSLGKMKIDIWALGYTCLDDTPSSCDKFTPVVLKRVDETRLAFFSVWEFDEATGNISNTITSRILELQTEVIRNSSDIDLRVLSRDSPLELCRGLSMEQGFRDDENILLNSNNFSWKPDVRTAAEAAGFTRVSQPNYCRRQRKPLCLMGIEPDPKVEGASLVLDFTSTHVPILQSFLSHVKTSYIQAQNSALLLQHPGTDFWMAAIALPGALIAVLAAAVPLINMQLRAFRALETSQRVKIIILCVCNTILSMISYSAAVALVPNELQKQRSFTTWGLLADQIPITRRLQVLVVAQGTSTYKSPSLLVVMLSIVLLIPLVVYITIYRCQQVFRRLKLLKDLREVGSEDEDGEQVLGDQTLDELQAIEMTNVEEHLLVKKLARLRSLKKRERLAIQPSPVADRRLRRFDL